jgi:cell volume regulation protein A
VLGNYPLLPYRNALTRVHDSFAWLSQIAMFLMLGLLVTPSLLLNVAWIGLGVGLFLAIVARPLVVWACLWPFNYTPRETSFIGWVGLRAAVPIVLATFPVLAEVQDGKQLFHLVFFIVVVSSFIPGATLRPVTRWMKMDVPAHPTPPAALEINSAQHLEGELTSFYIEPSLAVSGAHLREIDFPAGSAVVLIVRGSQLLAARGSTRLEPGDHVYVFCRPEDRGYIELLFGGPESE